MRGINARICGADTCFRAHGNHKKQSTVTGKERQDTLAAYQFIDDQMNALGEDMVEFRGLLQ